MAEVSVCLIYSIWEGLVHVIALYIMQVLFLLTVGLTASLGESKIEALTYGEQFINVLSMHTVKRLFKSPLKFPLLIRMEMKRNLFRWKVVKVFYGLMVSSSVE